MTHTLNVIGLVVTDMAATLAFYRRLGLDIPAAADTAPHAEVVLVPWPDGTITRCFGPDQARELFGGAGLRVSWIRSRTAFSESVVTHWLRRDPDGLPKLVRAELAARSDEPLGAQLVISASKPRPRTRS